MKLDRVPFAPRVPVGSLPLFWGPPGEILLTVSCLPGRLEKDGKEYQKKPSPGSGEKEGSSLFQVSLGSRAESSSGPSCPEPRYVNRELEGTDQPTIP